MKKIKINFSYNLKKISFLICFLILICISALLLNKAIKISENKIFTYTEKSKITYKVRLKNNDFYDQKVLDQDMSYIASLIDKIRINFKYVYKSNLKIDTKYKYDIVGVLEIKNQDNGEIFLEKEYSFLDSDEEIKKDKNIYEVNESILIDYNYYNKIANEFKREYKVDTISDLKVSLKIKREIDNKMEEEIETPKDLTITIPLSEDSVSIRLDYDDSYKNDTVLVDKKLNTKENIYLVSGGLLLITSIVILVFIKKLNIEPSKYEEKINKIKREFDRLLLEVSREPKYDDFEIINVNEFEELVDIYDMYNEPVRYIETKKDEECIFYIVHKKEIFMYKVR